MQVQSHECPVIRNSAMKRNNLPTLFLITTFLIIISCISCYQISKENADTNIFLRDNYVRVKRQIENLDNDDDYATLATQGVEEEPGFWDRVVKVALRLFNRFMEWLNS